MRAAGAAPIYVLFTKCDLMAGFIEFFDDVGEEREQVWGITFRSRQSRAAEPGPIEASTRSSSAARPARRACSMRVSTRSRHRSARPDLRSRTQMAALEPIQEFLERGLRATRYEEPGCCAASTSPAPPSRARRSTGSWAPSPAPSASTAGPAGVQRAGRSYFLTRLLREVVFRRSGLVTDDRLRRA